MVGPEEPEPPPNEGMEGRGRAGRGRDGGGEAGWGAGRSRRGALAVSRGSEELVRRRRRARIIFLSSGIVNPLMIEVKKVRDKALFFAPQPQWNAGAKFKSKRNSGHHCSMNGSVFTNYQPDWMITGVFQLGAILAT